MENYKRLSTMTIGYSANSYLENRTIIGKVSAAKYVKFRNWNKLFSIHVLRRLEKRIKFFSSSKLRYYNSYIGRPNCDIIHTFNTVCWTKVPWVVTFETMVPRFDSVVRLNNKSEFTFDRQVKRALDQIAKPTCRAVIALSVCAAKMQRRLHQFYKMSALDEKLFVLHPPQPVLIDKVETKTFSQIRPSVSCIFIGKEFFRKGGWESFKAAEQVNNELGYNAVKLTVVSRLSYGGYSEHPDAGLRKHEFLSAVNKYSWITYHDYIANGDLMKRLSGYDFGLLPTHADTYGFSVLELQATGVPCITTNVRALPEINNEECGWIIKVPVDECGEAYYGDRAEIETLERSIIDQCYEIMKRIALNPSVELKDRGCMALERIRRCHDPDTYGKRLAEIYRFNLEGRQK